MISASPGELPNYKKTEKDFLYRFYYYFINKKKK